MSCSVKGCKALKQFGYDNISFHRFPNNDPTYSLWVNACGRGNWKPPSVHSRICSIHFDSNSLIKSASVTCLVPGAVPTKFIHEASTTETEVPNKSEEQAIAAEEIVYMCRICLMTNRRMYDLNQYNLKAVYENVTNIQYEEDDRLPKLLCWECKHRLISSEKFTNLAKYTDNLLRNLLYSEPYLTQENLQSLDIEIESLASSLTLKTYPTNHTDLIVIEEHNDEVTKTDPEIQPKVEWEPYNDQHATVDTEGITDVSNNECNNKDELKKEISATKVVRRKKPVTDVLDPSEFNIIDVSIEDQMKEVVQRKHSENYKFSPHKCEECYKGFLDEESYKNHMVRHSDACGTYVCEVCKIHFSSLGSLRCHKALHVKKFCCMHCPYITNRRYAAKLHKDYHKGTIYSCSLCKEDFDVYSTYMSHRRIKHPSEIMCQLCGFSFVNDKGLTLHMKLMHRFDRTPVGTITRDSPFCEVCKTYFATVAALRTHFWDSPRHN